MNERMPIIASAAFLLVVLSAGLLGWFYFFGSADIDPAELVPGNTIAFAEIPNGMELASGYNSSDAKSILTNANFQPLRDYLVTNYVGQKNFDLLQAFLPNLTGQSFIAVTRYDYNKPNSIGMIAGLHPKSGLGDFGSFLTKLKEAYADQIKQASTGTETVDGVEYQWVQFKDTPGKLCMAQMRGWIVITLGEEELNDFIERFRNKASTSSLAEDVNFRSALTEMGENPMTITYVNGHAFTGIMQQMATKSSPACGDYVARKLEQFGGAMFAARFDNGKIVDHFSFQLPHPAQVEAGFTGEACKFDTLNFTGPDTHLYWAASMNWKQVYKNLREPEAGAGPTPVNPGASDLYGMALNWLRQVNLDGQHNILDALGPEISLQVDWSADAQWPEAGLFVQIARPEDFKPVIDAIIDTTRKAYASSAVVRELSLPNQKFAALKFIDPNAVLSPTITEDGSYFCAFLTERQAVRAFQRDEMAKLMHNANFAREVGDLRNSAMSLIFVDSPVILNRAYKTAMPYISLASMFNKDIAAMLKGRQMPDDLSWLAPVDAWSCTLTTDGMGIQGYSISGIDNQGMIVGPAATQGIWALEDAGYLPKFAVTSFPAKGPMPPPAPVPAVPPVTATMPNPVPPPPQPPPAPSPATNAPADAPLPSAPVSAPAQ